MEFMADGMLENLFWVLMKCDFLRQIAYNPHPYDARSLAAVQCKLAGTTGIQNMVRGPTHVHRAAFEQIPTYVPDWPSGSTTV